MSVQIAAVDLGSGDSEHVDVELSSAELEGRNTTTDGVTNEAHDAVSELKVPLTSAKTKRRPARLDLQEARKDSVDLEVAFSANLTHAQPIQDISAIQYPDGVQRPKDNLNVNAAPGRFIYDRDFLLQFMPVCKDKPDDLRPLDEIGIAPIDQLSSIRRPRGSRRAQLAPSHPPFVGSSDFALPKPLPMNAFSVTVGSGITPPSRSVLPQSNPVEGQQNSVGLPWRDGGGEVNPKRTGTRRKLKQA
ncbi:hypothetical protein GSI_04167 [Ganoderma sinense ZZ0214-1]|uniref:Eukaryotic translation initiation factor 4G1 eIF4E-binding domain-containing protein n=1 Tax=Ganoderma sinense ZZ0214-1 TaxID=1077348 RepID=A0A2G8SIE8_9APHY|nr:hypothetical protein GSI_04167 [Ganoderma sinense ZZ0214-1]